MPVVWHHVLPAPIAGIAGKGAWGVSQFFAISGFLITTLLLRERDLHGTVSMKDFYARRSLRILPLYYAVLFAYTLYAWSLGTTEPSRSHFFESLWWHATYSSNWFVNFAVAFPVIFAFSWSLATEEQFYLAWPWTIRLSRGPWVPVAVMVLLLAVDQSVERGFLEGVVDLGTGTRRILRSLSAPICLGALGALALHYRRSYALLTHAVGHKAGGPLLLLALMVAMALNVDDLAVHALMALLVVACCIRENHWLRYPLRVSTVSYVGRISYGIYLVHVAVIGGIRAIFADWQQSILSTYLLAMVGSVALASLSFHYFEQPLLAMRQRFRR